MYATTEFKKGLKIEYNGKPFVIVDFQHVNPGKGSAFVRTKLKNLETAQVLEITFKSGDKVPVPDLDFKEMQYLYNDGTNYTFMDLASYDQIVLKDDDLDDYRYYIIENSMVRVTFFQSRPVAIEVDNFVELRVKETQPNIKGDTSGGGGKPATMETGLVVTVPFHISEGDLLKIDTRTGDYVEKVKK
ncbi:MAG: elongation factor P [Proteobacteria bacterium]|nr:elongation factor P [Pseudomonadota bacterium]